MERKNRLLQEYIHDPYFTKEKYHDPSVCEKCGVVYSKGNFEWADKPPQEAHKILCPACRRIKDSFEGGTVTLEGEFLTAHKEEIMNVVKNTAEARQKKRPLERIMSVTDLGDTVKISTTYEHIARRIGEAVHSAYKGELKLQYPQGEKYIRVNWKR